MKLIKELDNSVYLLYLPKVALIRGAKQDKAFPLVFPLSQFAGCMVDAIIDGTYPGGTPLRLFYEYPECPVKPSAYPLIPFHQTSLLFPCAACGLGLFTVYHGKTRVDAEEAHDPA